MKLLIFAYEYPPEVGGAGIVASQFVKVMSDKGHNVSLLTRENANLDVPENVNVYPILKDGVTHKSKYFKYLVIVWTYLRLLFFKMHKYDRILINDYPASLAASILFSKKTLGRCVFMWHGSENIHLLKEKSLIRRLYVEALKKSFKVLAVSDFQKEKILVRSAVEFLRSKVFVQYAGIDSHIFNVKKEVEIKSIRKRLGFLDTDIIIVTVGRLIDQKGHKEMYDIIRSQSNNVKWIVIGTGENEKWLKKNITSNKDTNIYLLGKKDRGDINDYYNIANLFLLYSKDEWEEAFGLVYIEAALAGLPSIAKKKLYDGTNESVFHNGWLFDTKQQVISFIKSEEYLDCDREGIRSKALKFSLDSLADGIEKNICK